jgi:ribonuclease BN (tRNA processing enzyme)
MRVYFCGVRGSTPAPGLPFVRYGGHTSSVALAHDGERPTLVLDAGTGLREVTNLLGAEPFRGTILLSHLHWDHVHGLPFFQGGAREGHRVDVLLPAVDGDPVGTIARGISPPHFPVGPLELGVGWSYSALEEGPLSREGFDVEVHEIPHKGGRAFGFRVSDGSGSVAYLPDHFPLGAGSGPEGIGALHPAALALARDVDVLVHDAQFVQSEFPAVTYLGHSAIEYAVSLARAAHARALVLFHHSPARTDDEIDAIAARWEHCDVPVIAAAERTQAWVSGGTVEFSSLDETAGSPPASRRI